MVIITEFLLFLISFGNKYHLKLSKHYISFISFNSFLKKSSLSVKLSNNFASGFKYLQCF